MWTRRFLISLYINSLDMVMGQNPGTLGTVPEFGWLMEVYSSKYGNNRFWPIPIHMGLSENSVPLNPMVLLIIIPIKWLFHWEYTLFSDKPIYGISDLSENSAPPTSLITGNKFSKSSWTDPNRFTPRKSPSIFMSPLHPAISPILMKYPYVFIPMYPNISQYIPIYPNISQKDISMT